MSIYGYPVLYALFLWWFSTGAIVYLDGLPRRTHPWTMAGATVLLALALWGLGASSADTSVAGAFVAFTCGLLVWGWNETAFLLGYVTGPRRVPSDPDAPAPRRFIEATATILYHEIAILVSLAAIYAVTWAGPNHVGLWTFAILWLMRLSTKLNVFLGVRNLTEEFLPEHLGYLKSYFARRPMNLLFPFTVTGSTVATVLLAIEAMDPAVSAFEAAGYAFLATLMALAVLEHWFLVLPLDVASLWRWGLTTHRRDHGRPGAARPGRPDAPLIGDVVGQQAASPANRR